MAVPLEMGLQPFEILGAASVLLVVVLGVYGAFIKMNYDRANTLYTRLFGEDDDGTQAGFIEESEDRFEDFNKKLEGHAVETHKQLYQVDRKLDILIERSDIDTDRDGLPRVPPPESRDFMRGGGSRTDDTGDNLPPSRTGNDD